MTDLGLICLIICCACWDLDYSYVGMFGNISCPLDDCTTRHDAWDDTLHEFEFGNVEVIEDRLFFAMTT